MEWPVIAAGGYNCAALAGVLHSLCSTCGPAALSAPRTRTNPGATLGVHSKPHTSVAELLTSMSTVATPSLIAKTTGVAPKGLIALPSPSYASSGAAMSSTGRCVRPKLLIVRDASSPPLAASLELTFQYGAVVTRKCRL